MVQLFDKIRVCLRYIVVDVEFYFIIVDLIRYEMDARRSTTRMYCDVESASVDSVLFSFLPEASAVSSLGTRRRM